MTYYELLIELRELALMLGRIDDVRRLEAEIATYNTSAA